MNVCIARRSVRAHGLFPLFLPPSPARYSRFLPISPTAPPTPPRHVPLSTFASPFLSPRLPHRSLCFLPYFSCPPRLSVAVLRSPPPRPSHPIGPSLSLLRASRSLVDNCGIFFPLFPLYFSFVRFLSTPAACHVYSAYCTRVSAGRTCALYT